jgi:thiamine-phosphate pyrophosphorylase
LTITTLEALWREARKLRLQAGGRKPLPPLLFFTDPVRTPDPEGVLRQLPRGAGLVYRAFGAADAASKGHRLARIARGRGVMFFVGADAALAIALRAGGLHLPERLADRPGWILRLRRRFVVTAAAHSLPAILRARRAGVDAIVISPVFPSASPSAGRPLGPRRFALLVRAASAPAYALGGVDAVSARRLRRSAAVGLAVVSALAMSARSAAELAEDGKISIVSNG